MTSEQQTIRALIANVRAWEEADKAYRDAHNDDALQALVTLVDEVCNVSADRALLLKSVRLLSHSRFWYYITDLDKWANDTVLDQRNGISITAGEMRQIKAMLESEGV